MAGFAWWFVVIAAVWSGGGTVQPATEWIVSAGARGSGTRAAPFGRIQEAIDAARPGDVIVVGRGTYVESLRSVRAGLPGAPIRVRADAARGDVLVTHAGGRVLTVNHASLIVEGLVFDGQYGPDDAIRVDGGAAQLVLRDLEVRRSSGDLIDLATPRGVLIERCLLHHALNPANGRADAHGIVAGAVQDLTIRDTEIHTFSGDGIQIDPGRAAPGWNRMTIERTRIWLSPLAAPANGFPAGTVPGENAIDTKSGAAFPRATLLVRDSDAWGFRGGLIDNMAAFNIKENVEATFDGVTVHDSEIAFRVRGATSTAPAGAWVAVRNAVVYGTGTAFRYENDIERLRIVNSTIGRNVPRAFRAAESHSRGLEVRNLLVLGTLPSEAASQRSNLAAGPNAFVNSAADDYRLVRGSPAIDAGIPIAEVSTDRAGRPRPQGRAFDIGAFEFPTSVIR